jgi:sugar-specific transcriptional regulator TrmB
MQSATKLKSEATRSVVNELRALGLSAYEAQAYVALIQNPYTSATQLCNETGIPDSKIYFALEELQKKGLVVVSEGVPRHYKALPPKQALGKLKGIITQQYEAQIGKLSQLSLALDPLYSKGEKEDIELAYVVKGFDNVLTRMIEVLSSARREATIFVPSVEILERMATHLEKIHRGGVKIRLAVPPKVLKQFDITRLVEARELTQNCMDSWLVMVDGKTVISSSEWKTERCHAILTQDPIIVAMSREYFESPRCCTTI